MKKMKIIVPILLIIIALVGAAIFVLSTGKIAVTPKSKVAVGLSKTLNTFDESEGVISQNGYKILENLKGKAYETDVTMSVDADVEDLEGLVGDKETAGFINDILDTLAATKISSRTAVDPKEGVAKIDLGLENEELIGNISGEVAISGDEIAFRSKELNDEYLSLKRKDVEEQPELVEVFDLLQQVTKVDYTAFMFTEKEKEHFSDTYGKILSDSVKDDMVTSEKAEFTVNGSKQSCTKAILTYNNDQVKALLKEYVTTFEKDEKGREILQDKVSKIYGKKLTDELFDEIDTAVESLNEAIDEITDTKLEFVTYATATQTFGTETILTIAEESAIIKETFNDDATNIVFNILGEDVANIVVKQDKDNLSVEYTMEVEEIKADVKFAINKNKMDLSFSFEEDGELLGEVGMIMEVDTKKDSAKELNQDLTLKITFDIPIEDQNVAGKVTLKWSEKIAVLDSVEFPDTSKATSVLNQEDLQEYVTDMQDAAKKYLDKLQKNDLVKDIIEFSSNATKKSDLLEDMDKTDIKLPDAVTDKEIDDIIDDKDTDDTIAGKETDDTTSKEDYTEEVNPEDFEKDIKTWYTELEKDDELKKSEIIEENMISEMDFDDIVEIETYISWEEGEPTDKGYVGIEVTDSDDNSYEFYIDIEKDTVYTEDTVTFDTEKISWNEF